MIQDYVTGSITGTGAAIAKDVGFIPDGIKVWNPTNNCEMEWHVGMGTSLCKKIPPSGGVASVGLTQVLTSPGASMGTTKDHVANITFKYMIKNVTYTKAAVAAGTAPTATTIPQNKYGLFGFQIDAAGTVSSLDAAGNGAGTYATAAAAIAALPTASSAHLLFMYVVVTSTESGGFVGATTTFDATGVTATFYNVAHSGYATSNVLKSLDTSTSATGVRGISIPADTDLNILGQTIYYEAWR